MKYFLLLLGISCLLWGACKKNVDSRPVSEVHGTLYFQDPTANGLGFFYKIDTSAEIILSPDFADPKWKVYINVHTSLKFIDTGAKDLLQNDLVAGRAPLRSVNVVSFTALP